MLKGEITVATHVDRTDTDLGQGKSSKSNAVLDVIKSRRSIRSFSNKALAEEDEKALKDSIRRARDVKAPLGTSYELVQIPLTPHDRDRMKISSYGFIIGEQGFIVGICENSKDGLIDLGHSMEAIVIDLTSRGIGTCWMVSTFKRSAFDDKIDLQEGQILAAIIAYGYPSRKPSIFDRLAKFSSKSDQRLPFNNLFFMNDFSNPIYEGECYHARPCLEAVRAAPSGYNKQPWRIVVEEGRLHLYIERVHAYASKRLGFDMQYLDIGIAMSHMEAICGKDGHWTFDDPGIEVPNQEYEYIATMNYG